MPAAPTPFADPLRLSTVIDIGPHHHEAELDIDLRPTRMRLHSELPDAEFWGYRGEVPGPTVNLQRGTRLRVRWKNCIPGTLPFPAVHVPTTDPALPDALPQNNPGLDGAAPDPLYAAVPAWTVTHLHGGRTPPDSDGWPTNAVLYEQQILTRHENDQRAAMLWYHDHAMHVTRFNVYAGLAGFWAIRDAQDDAIMAALAAAHGGHPFRHEMPIEVPLLIQDRNLGLGPDGQLDGTLVHKVENAPLPAGSPAPDVGPMEFFGPYTLVNGGIWPHMEVKPRPYRLRLLNGSNARTYQLVLLGPDGQPVASPPLQQIGTDGGLMGVPVPVTPEGLILAPAERADLVVDFSAFPDGTDLTWVNVAVAPYDGTAIAGAPGTPDAANRVPFPNVMQFRVRGTPSSTALALPEPLSDFARLDHTQFGQHEHRLVALREEVGGPFDGLLTLWELQKVQLGEPAPAAGDAITVAFDIEAAADSPDAHAPTTYRVMARLFDDRLNFSVRLGGFEVWHFLNLTTDTHPMHVHLVQFQVTSKERYRTLDAGGTPIDPATTSPASPLAFLGPQTIPPNEVAWKDTVRVNPGEKTTIAARFDGFAGRYVYHCHVLEHEDHDMMRPFDVLPLQVDDIMMRNMPMTQAGDHGH